MLPSHRLIFTLTWQDVVHQLLTHAKTNIHITPLCVSPEYLKILYTDTGSPPALSLLSLH